MPSDNRPTTPREVFTAFQNALDACDFTTVLGFYAENVRVSAPFAKPEPSVFEGRAALVAHFEGRQALPLELSAVNRVIHETADPEVIVVEYDYDVLHRTTGKRARIANIIVARIRNGLILESRDYHDHTAIAELLTP